MHLSNTSMNLSSKPLESCNKFGGLYFISWIARMPGKGLFSKSGYGYQTFDPCLEYRTDCKNPNSSRVLGLTSKITLLHWKCGLQFVDTGLGFA